MLLCVFVLCTRNCYRDTTSTCKPFSKPFTGRSEYDCFWFLVAYCDLKNDCILIIIIIANNKFNSPELLEIGYLMLVDSILDVLCNAAPCYLAVFSFCCAIWKASLVAALQYDHSDVVSLAFLQWQNPTSVTTDSFTKSFH